MKKFLMVISVLMFSVTSFAQIGKTTISGHFGYLLDSPNNCGIGANIGYEFAENWRGVAQFDYYFNKDHVSMWNPNVNVEYLFPLADGKFFVYPLAGLNVLGQSYDEGSDSKLGLNIGCGFEMPLNDRMSFKCEYCYKTQYDGFSTLNLGLVFPF
jgi:opacity protein-like surface antigen